MEEYNHEAKKQLGTDLFDHRNVSLEAAATCVEQFGRHGLKEAQCLFKQDCMRSQGATDKVPNPKDTREWRLEKENTPTKGKGTTQRKRTERKGQRQSSRKRTECSVRNTRSKFV